MIRPKPLLWLLVLLCAEQRSFGQQPLVTDMATSREAVKLTDRYEWASFDKPVSNDSLPYLSLQPVKPGEYPIRKNNFTRHFVFVFALANSSAKPDTILLMPGLQQQVTPLLYDTILKTLTPITETTEYTTPYTLETLQFLKIVLPPGSYRKLFIQTSFHHFNWDFWDPTVYHQGTVDDKMLVYQYPVEMRSHMYAAVQLGILLAILGYTIILFFQYRQQEYLWYLAYVFLITLYFVIMAVGNLSYSVSFHRFDMFLPPFTQISAHLIYFFFAKKILNLPKNKPFFNKLINIVIGILTAYLIFHSVVSFDDKFYPLNALGFYLVRIFLCAFSLYGIVVLYRSHIPLSSYIATGVLCVTVFGLVSMFLASLPDSGNTFMSYAGGSITFFRIGVVIELFVFLVAITEKSKTEIINKVRTIELLQIENQKKELEKSMIALETQTAERKRISAEMHDDIGSGLTTIQFLTNALPREKTTANDQALRKITATSQQLMDKMNEIVWSLNQEFDTLGDTIAYIRNTVSDLLENAGIQYDFVSPENIPDLQVSGETRRNLYLVVKEATHNIIKHAHATMVKYTVTTGDQLIIRIHDNGKGIRSTPDGFGNGLRNMKQRMKDCGGEFSIVSENGVLVTLVLPLNS